MKVDPEQFNREISILQKINNRSQHIIQCIDTYVEKTETDKIVEIIKKKQDILNQEIKIEDFIKSFSREYSRQPTVIEIFENLEETVEKDTLNKFISKSQWLNRGKR